MPVYHPSDEETKLINRLGPAEWASQTRMDAVHVSRWNQDTFDFHLVGSGRHLELVDADADANEKNWTVIRSIKDAIKFCRLPATTTCLEICPFTGDDAHKAPTVQELLSLIGDEQKKRKGPNSQQKLDYSTLEAIRSIRLWVPPSPADGFVKGGYYDGLRDPTHGFQGLEIYNFVEYGLAKHLRHLSLRNISLMTRTKPTVSAQALHFDQLEELELISVCAETAYHALLQWRFYQLKTITVAGTREYTSQGPQNRELVHAVPDQRLPPGVALPSTVKSVDISDSDSRIVTWILDACRCDNTHSIQLEHIGLASITNFEYPPNQDRRETELRDYKHKYVKNDVVVSHVREDDITYHARSLKSLILDETVTWGKAVKATPSLSSIMQQLNGESIFSRAGRRVWKTVFGFPETLGSFAVCVVGHQSLKNEYAWFKYLFENRHTIKEFSLSFLLEKGDDEDQCLETLNARLTKLSGGHLEKLRIFSNIPNNFHWTHLSHTFSTFSKLEELSIPAGCLPALTSFSLPSVRILIIEATHEYDDKLEHDLETFIKVAIPRRDLDKITTDAAPAAPVWRLSLIVVRVPQSNRAFSAHLCERADRKNYRLVLQSYVVMADVLQHDESQDVNGAVARTKELNKRAANTLAHAHTQAMERVRR
ncbi:hypothetical protein T439DRAFT_376278 [Meredithblackwellia eburnea MCA 4105]